MRSQHIRIKLLRYFASIFVVGVILNYVWEIAQSPFFAATNNLGNMWWHCFVASLGDGVILWIIYATGWIVLRRTDWFTAPGFKGFCVMIASGLVIAVAIEWVAVHVLQRWTYAASMPVISGLNIGLIPILQMLILPPLIFYLAALWLEFRQSSTK